MPPIYGPNPKDAILNSIKGKGKEELITQVLSLHSTIQTLSSIISNMFGPVTSEKVIEDAFYNYEYKDWVKERIESAYNFEGKKIIDFAVAYEMGRRRV
jgi:hypothetical protein